ncbi:hypothetical protein CI610_03731 [invertebrate metagenome]|uniref:Uncharacterized protein n=1 Tax=invertebrate metagenome TaxID=1711999 RepID=A0A2H9T2A2_9ZZZZ
MTLGSHVCPWGGGKLYYSLYREITFLTIICWICIGIHSNLYQIISMGLHFDGMYMLALVDPQGLVGGAKKGQID